ncbi:hypothetical protein MYX07_00280 [Patescibacteria group bacterium AH-259-L07]|nr:hypothetical protein [Patescibacteria group bacterium AH-259-L07]
MDQKINERILKILGTAILPEMLKIDHDYTIGLTINITDINKKSRQDGSYNFIHKGKMLGELLVQKDFGKKIFAPTKGSSSKKWRDQLWALSEDYEDYMRVQRANGEEFIALYKKLRDEK